MGHLFSRAIKRLTFGAGGSNSGSSSRSASRNQLPGNEQQEHAQSAGLSSSQREQDQDRPIVQAIPVGQSIDSSEYAAFENASSVLPKQEQQSSRDAEQTRPQPPLITTTTSAEEALDQGDKENAQADNLANNDDKNKPQVEEAVIKIQALVRGHLTRKALKDAQQHAASVAPNALGQRQFDEESLIKNPPSAIFLPSSPLSSSLSNNESGNNDQQQQQQQQQPSSKHANMRVPPLESIAEDVETSANNQDTSATPSSEERRREKRRLSSSKGSPPSSEATTATPSSPQPSSEANASIDIHCDTPASATIVILDHNSKPSFGMASVLHSTASAPVVGNDGASQSFETDHHHTVASRVLLADTMSATTGSLPSSPPHINLAATGNSHSIDSAEAAAIRIQSAFRGYHTRKHSPYRRRSPAGSATAANNDSRPRENGYGGAHSGPARFRNTLRQQDATTMEEDDNDEGIETCERLEATPSSTPAEERSSFPLDGRLSVEQLAEESAENRQSRQRHRAEGGAAIADAQVHTSSLSVEDLDTAATDDQSTVKEMSPHSDAAAAASAATSHRKQDSTSSGAAQEAASNIEAGLSLGANSAKLTNEEDEDVVRELRAPLSERVSKLSADGWSVEMDTESSNLGAALSLNDDLSEGSSAEQKLAAESATSAAIDNLTSEARSVAGQLGGELERAGAGHKGEQQELDLGREALDQLNAALVDVIDDHDYESGKLAETLANTILEDGEEPENANDPEEEQHRASELESDDIERRDPRGHASEDPTRSPQIRTESFEDQQPALVSSSSFEEQERAVGDRENNQERLEVISPDEAIGSGQSSPALVSSSNGDNSTDDEADADAEDQEEAAASGNLQAPAAQSGGQQQQQQQQQQQASGGNKNKKKNRNKRKGKK